MKDFAGRTAFVTGGAHGVGIGLTRALLAQGCNVAIADIRGASIDAALKAIDNPRAMGVTVDVASRQDMARAADAVEAKFGVSPSCSIMPASICFKPSKSRASTIGTGSWG
jgi:NAD(P)-dependent dehydrogenase (short-subunit alcohol dehydrogenase family)